MTEVELINAQADLIAAQQNIIDMMSGKITSGIPIGNMIKKKDIAVQKSEKEITFSQYAKTFLESKKSTTKKSTYHTYVWTLNKHILPELGDVELSKIDNSCLQRFADEKLKTLSKKSVHEFVGLIKNVLNDACLNEVIEPKKFMIKYPKSENSDYKTLSEEEFIKLEKYLLLQKKPHDIGELIMLETGMRIGEMCGLKWEDIDLERGMVEIKRTVQRIYESEDKITEINIGNTKTNAGKRAIPISEKICNYLKMQKRNDDIYIASGKETPTEPRTHREYHTRLMNKLGIEYITPHGLRHTFATRAIQSGVDPKTVSAILGHSNSNITLNIYTSVTEDMLRKGIEKMNKELLEVAE